MGFQTSWGSIYARIGADTSDFQAKLAQSNTILGQWAGGNEQHGMRVERSLIRVSRGSAEVMRSFGIMGGQSAMAVQMILDKVGLLEMALPVGLAMMAPQIGAFINKITGLGAAFATIGPPTQAMAEDLAANADGFEAAQTTLKHLLAQLGIAQPLWLQSGQRTKENAEQTILLMGTLHNEVEERKKANTTTSAYVAQQIVANAKLAEAAKLHKESVDWLVKEKQSQIEFNNAWGKMIPVGTQIAIALGKGQQAMKELGQETIKAYGILSETSARASVDDMQKKLRAVAIEGGDAGQVMAKMGPDILQVVEDAKAMGVALPPVMEDVALAISEKNKLWLGDLMTGLGKTPAAASAASAASAKYLDDMGNKLEGSISGGFGRGIEKGTNFGKQQIDAFRAEVEQTPIVFKIEGDWSGFRDQCKKHGVNFGMDTY